MIHKLCVVYSFFALSVLFAPNSSFADYIGSSGGAPFRIHDDGTPAPPTYDTSNTCCLIESLAEAVALTPDRTKAYGLTNTLGFANYVLAWNNNTGQRLPADSFPLSGPSNGNNYIAMYAGNTQPIIRANELFALSPVYTGSFADSNNWQIKRFDLTSHSLLEVINPPITQHLYDIEINPTGSVMFVAGTAGIYQYAKFFGNYNTPPNIPPVLIIPGVDGNIALGPDTLLYVRNFVNGDVQRYTTAGLFVDTFISHTIFPNLGTIQFGVDGNLHAYQGGSSPRILKFNTLNGSLLSSTTYSFMYLTNGRITYLVPEPQIAVLLCVGAPFFLTQRRNKARCALKLGPVLL